LEDVIDDLAILQDQGDVIDIFLGADFLKLIFLDQGAQSILVDAMKDLLKQVGKIINSINVMEILSQRVNQESNLKDLYTQHLRPD
jgi:hypothetical protein